MISILIDRPDTRTMFDGEIECGMNGVIEEAFAQQISEWPWSTFLGGFELSRANSSQRGGSVHILTWD